MQVHENERSAMGAPPKLISHELCSYVQRAVIALTEKGVPFERVDIDLANKPDWFLAVSPLGKTLVLLVGDVPIFESTVILEYLEETQPKRLHPADPVRRAEHRGWIEFGSAVLSDVAGFYAALDQATFNARTLRLEQRFARLEARAAVAPWFDGENFSLVDAVFGPVFRYFDVFDEIADFGIFADKPKLIRWRLALAARPSVRAAVSADYPALLRAFIERRNSWLSGLQARAAA
jgi:glutathione S-transferase